MPFTFGSCGHPLRPNGVCRVCWLCADWWPVDAAHSGWLITWRGREGEANAIDQHIAGDQWGAWYVRMGDFDTERAHRNHRSMVDNLIAMGSMVPDPGRVRAMFVSVPEEAFRPSRAGRGYDLISGEPCAEYMNPHDGRSADACESYSAASVMQAMVDGLRAGAIAYHDASRARAPLLNR